MGLFDFIFRAQKKATGTSKSARSTENIDKQIIALRDQMKRNGFEEYEFIANRTCCEVCGKLNGKHFPLSEFKIGVNAPPMHDGCRCSITSYSGRTEYEEWLDFISKGGTTKDYNKRKRG